MLQQASVSSRIAQDQDDEAPTATTTFEEQLIKDEHVSAHETNEEYYKRIRNRIQVC